MTTLTLIPEVAPTFRFKRSCLPALYIIVKIWKAILAEILHHQILSIPPLALSLNPEASVIKFRITKTTFTPVVFFRKLINSNFNYRTENTF